MKAYTLEVCWIGNLCWRCLDFRDLFLDELKMCFL